MGVGQGLECLRVSFFEETLSCWALLVLKNKNQVYNPRKQQAVFVFYGRDVVNHWVTVRKTGYNMGCL